jgi:protoporphyrinogen oxidase
VKAGFDHLISSIPLPELIPMVAGVPDDVREACGKLAATNCVMVNVVVDRPDLTDATWTYFYDKDIFFTRLSFPYKYSAKTVPEGTSSLQAEVYFSEKYRPQDIEPDEAIEPVLRDLRRCGLVKEDDTLLFTNATSCKYANVIFDLDRADAVATVHGFLDEVGIRYVGRYGEWGYHWTDESFISGENAAQAVLDGNNA